jgi:serine/threonine protein phosphatase PrpC
MIQARSTITCPNLNCQAANSVGNDQCEECGMVIPYRYLWVKNSSDEIYQSNELIADRYLVIQSGVVLDTKPNESPLFPEEIDEESTYYAELFPYRNQVPQIFGFFEQKGVLVALLENSAIYPYAAIDNQGKSIAGQLFPQLLEAWNISSFLQKLSWFYQLALIWQPLGRLGKTQSILDPYLVRVDGDCLKILYLVSDQTVNPSIQDFANVWQVLLEQESGRFWHDLFKQMIQGQIYTSETLLAILDQELQMIHLSSGSQPTDIEITAMTHRGPTRSENQDACYPSSESHITTKSPDSAWLAVCDGIGGHEGGSLASQTAIATVKQYLQNLDLADCSSEQIVISLENAVFAANDAICERNDREGRQEKQRMGTTIVLAYSQGARLYVTHVGDSRAYRISATGCYQITVDDDLATRETIYGNAYYREATRYPGTGSLTQALGMGASTQLQPTSQMLVLNEPSIILLCSDGLSDFDRIEESWPQEILPVLRGERSAYEATQRLIDLANIQNGHDNVTVGLLYFHGQAATTQLQTSKTELIGPTLMSLGSSNNQNAQGQNKSRSPRPVIPRTQPVNPPRQNMQPLKWAFAFLICAGVFGGAGFWGLRYAQEWFGAATPEASPTPAKLQVATNRFLKVEVSPAPLTLLAEPGYSKDGTEAQANGFLPPGTIVELKGGLVDATKVSWTRLKVCSVPADAVTASVPEGGTPLKPIAAGSEGWQQESQVTAKALPVRELLAGQLGICDPNQPALASPSSEANPAPSLLSSPLSSPEDSSEPTSETTSEPSSDPTPATTAP